MKYTILIILALILCTLASPVYAWPEPKQYPVVWLTTQTKEGYWVIGIYQGARWPATATNKLTDREYKAVCPPQLNPIQANRWYIASPAARTYLAQIYNIPKDVAIQYGAHYIKALQVWEDDDIPNRYYCR